MALYLGANKVELKVNNMSYNLNIFSGKAVATAMRLLSLDNYTLKDADDIYLTSQGDDLNETEHN